MTKPDNSPNKATGFFTVALTVIDDIVKQGGSANEMATYLVLIRGTGAKTYSSWGANAVANYTGLTYYKASECIAWLQKHEFIKQSVFPIGDNPQKTKLKWQFMTAPDELPLALTNTLIDGQGAGVGNPPLARLLNEISMGRHGIKAARIDALMTLLHFYKHHLLAEYGGINPHTGIYKRWTATVNTSIENQCAGNLLADLGDTNTALYEIKGSDSMVYVKFAKEALFYVSSNEERSERFWDAFNNLLQLGWIYETTQIWSGDALEDKDAEPLYTLYIHDRHARSSDPYLANIINKIVIKHLNPDYGFFSSEGLFEDEFDLFKGQFRYIAFKKDGGFPIGIYRMKFRAHTKDTGKGIAAEQERVNRWESVLTTILEKI